MYAYFIAPILAALRWMGMTAFTGLGGATVGGALFIGFTVVLARVGVAFVIFTVIFTATTAMTDFAVSQMDSGIWVDMLASTGMFTGINIMLSTMQSIIAIRVAKIGFMRKVTG
jgi:hypothetical protein